MAFFRMATAPALSVTLIHMAVMVWAGECKRCHELSAVRPSESSDGRIEFPNPSRISKVICPHCGESNEFSDVELKQVLASVVRKSEL